MFLPPRMSSMFGARPPDPQPTMPVRLAALSLALLATSPLPAQQPAPVRAPDSVTVITPARVFDGQDMHEGWAVVIRGEKIAWAGPAG